jgi:hypothetical protein
MCLLCLRVQQKTVLSATDGKGLQIKSSWARRNGTVFMDLVLSNMTTPATTLNNFAIKFNVNYAGLTPAAPLRV